MVIKLKSRPEAWNLQRLSSRMHNGNSPRSYLLMWSKMEQVETTELQSKYLWKKAKIIRNFFNILSRKENARRFKRTAASTMILVCDRTQRFFHFTFKPRKKSVARNSSLLNLPLGHFQWRREKLILHDAYRYGINNIPRNSLIT